MKTRYEARLESSYLMLSKYSSFYRNLNYENYKEEAKLNSKRDKREPLEKRTLTKTNSQVGRTHSVLTKREQRKPLT